ncbi:ribosome biogenesis GTPase Der [Pseudoroseomonas ludipueritiae]|uniref:GTPase Der n=1 Tax=Pseudoroseomonas ludipueritiae TaxID=198093 RepID=A0ABR7R3W1_9PROT|nr:ribosome biogenesis GTPase Der [Pseudoroseomonas ludipueritiae]MBC9176369.1 ribosome biogenesis GTPase Der [Pseudoroseomonas ludipueritiae]MCG7362954.1 ribosome biogenesis GTPase Der [Roseomonas sp. ACRSG]
MLPRIAIIGRPNVGKSTLFNRLVGRKLAIVDNTPGVTRDRKEYEARIGGRDVMLLDTAGLEEAPPDTVAGRMRASSEAAIQQADLILFVVDAKAGLTASDRAFAAWLRRQKVPVLAVANKTEGRGGTMAALEAYELGFGDPVAISAEHGEGISDLHSTVAAMLPEEPEEEEEDDKDRPLRMAVVGRPNAGKSTLLNALLGEERMITGPEPGLTRDAVTSEFNDAVGRVRIVDTAGMRKKARIVEGLEQMSVGATINALKEAEVAVLVLDALLGLDEQDLRIARLAEREGRAVVIALNKWDAVEDRVAARRSIEDTLQTSLAQLKGITVVAMSAATGRGVDKLMPAVRETMERWNKRVPTGELNRWFEGALSRHQPPLADGRRIKLRYATMPKARPPTIVVFGPRAEDLPEDYRRYLVNSFRDAFDMPGVPIRLQMRGTSNPFVEQE